MYIFQVLYYVFVPYTYFIPSILHSAIENSVLLESGEDVLVVEYGIIVLKMVGIVKRRVASPQSLSLYKYLQLSHDRIEIHIFLQN